MSASVYFFPASRMVGKARRLVALRRTTPVSKMSRIWAETVGEIDRAMCRIGFSEGERRQEVDAFYHLVKAEIVRVDYEGAPPETSSGDAA